MFTRRNMPRSSAMTHCVVAVTHTVTKPAGAPAALTTEPINEPTPVVSCAAARDTVTTTVTATAAHAARAEHLVRAIPRIYGGRRGMRATAVLTCGAALRA